jgi:putative oxidoreductase
MRTGNWAFVDFNHRVGLPLPVLVAYLQSLNESVGALLVASGLFTRYAAGCLSGAFVVAAYCSFKIGEETWLMAAHFALMFAALMLTGPGRLSIDCLLKSRTARGSRNL